MVCKNAMEKFKNLTKFLEDNSQYFIPQKLNEINSSQISSTFIIRNSGGMSITAFCIGDSWGGVGYENLTDGTFWSYNEVLTVLPPETKSLIISNIDLLEAFDK